jgi:hypothetical protein
MLIFIMQIIRFRTDCLLLRHKFTLHGLETEPNILPSTSFTLVAFVVLFVGVAIVNFFFHHEESALQWIIFLALHDVNIRHTTLFTVVFYLRGHVTLDC